MIGLSRKKNVADKIVNQACVLHYAFGLEVLWKMKSRISLIFTMLGLLFSTGVAAAPNFESPEVKNCTSTLINCATALFNMNRNTTDYSSCAAPFATCVSEYLFSDPPPTPEACYLAESAWENLYISIGAFLGIVMINNFIVPAVTKAFAYGITKCMEADVGSHPIINRIGRVMGIFTDADRDGRVMATELTNPQAIVMFTGLALPFYYWFIANDAEQKCNYAWALYKYANPEVDDDDMFKY